MVLRLGIWGSLRYNTPGSCKPLNIFGFTLTWFLLGIGFFPAVWVISFYFIRRSIALEEEEVNEAKPESGKVGK